MGNVNPETKMSQIVSNEKRFYTVQQFSNYIGADILSKASIYMMIRRGQVPVVQANKRILIPAKWVYQFCNSADYKLVTVHEK